MAYTENKSIDGLIAITPTIDDLVVTMDQAEVGVAKSSTLALIYTLFKTTYDTLYAKYLGDADFYKYSITTSVASGNLTVTLLNYLGATPSATAPVKIQIGGVIRTITSALSCPVYSGANALNLGSAELATKEADIFVHLYWYDTATPARVGLCISRIPTITDMSASFTPEKGVYIDYDGSNSPSATTPVVNIGRFNATLSAGGAYTWSIPATSVIIQRPIYHTNHIFQTAIVGDGTNTATITVNGSNYQIDNQYLRITLDITISNKNSCSGAVRVKAPFSVSGISGTHALSGGFKGGLGGIGTPIIYANDIRFLSSSSSFSELQWSSVTNGDRFIVTGFYPI